MSSIIEYNEGDILLYYGTHRETGKYHLMVDRNHKTPSGMDRFMLWLSGDIGYDTLDALKESARSLIQQLKEQGYTIINEQDFFDSQEEK